MTDNEFLHLIKMYNVDTTAIAKVIPCDRKTLWTWRKRGITPEQEKLIYTAIERTKLNEIAHAQNDLAKLKFMEGVKE